MMFCYLSLFIIIASMIPISFQSEVTAYQDGKGLVNPIVLEGKYNINYTHSVNNSREYIFQFDEIVNDPARITVECYDSNRTYPILIVVRQQKGVLSWQLPLIVETATSRREYFRTNRTLCPDNNYYVGSDFSARSRDVIVSISTASPQNVTFSLLVKTVVNFSVPLSKIYDVHVSPSEPSYYAFKFREEYPDTVLLRVDSEDEICTAVSIQDLSCPVFDLERNVQFEGYWQTISSKGSITLSRDVFSSGFYVVFVVKGDDYDCTGVIPGYANSTMEPRRKHLTFSLSPGITYQDYIIATLSTAAVFVSVYILCFVIAIMYYVRRRRQPSEISYLDEDSCLSPSSTVPTIYGEIQSPVSEASTVPRCNSDSSLDETDIDMLQDANSEKDIFRTKTFLYVCDLARKEPRILRKKSNLYLWNLLTVAVFYSLPVVQLVITYQLVLNKTGDQDLCYYNFMCAHPFGLLSDFNHVFSNIGYVVLGFLFILLTWRRDRMHRLSDQRLDKFYGIPQHYGLFYALGVGLMMEGILSGCYHVCPNHSNFQFDTSFMYVIAMLCMLKIYQTRHPDINASAYSTFALLALIIFVGMFGVLNGKLYFWIIFTIVHLLTCLILSVQIYYMGRWKCNWGTFKRVFSVIYHDFRASPLHCMKPMYPNRMVLLVLGNVANWALAVYGLMYHRKDFATYLLSIFMANLLLYTMFYIVMKLCYREKILPQPLIYIILACVAWGAALYFFLNKSISWALTPAESKYYNKPCILFNFYDNHDIWHFLSGGSMFFSFMVLLTLDDDLIFVHRSKIPVF